MCEKNLVSGILAESGILHWGVAGFESLAGRLNACAALNRLPERPSAVITAIFPYYTGAHKGGNISKYAMPGDYHTVVGGLLKKAALGLSASFPGHEFACFCDASPLPEVEAARLAGLGDVGLNGLLISPDYGSYVFIGEIVTDLQLEPSGRPGAACSGCGACAKSCPAGAISAGSVDKNRCLSAVTQRKGLLTAAEESLIRCSGCVWGCDICQDVCPLNAGVLQTDIAGFKTGIKKRLDQTELADAGFGQKNRGRAFMWRGIAVLKRNICIIDDGAEDNILQR